MQDFTLIPLALRQISHPSYDIWAAFVKFSADWELDQFEAKMAWDFFRAGTVAKIKI